MKKIGLLFVTIIMMMLFAVSASAATEGYYTYEVENGEATITYVDQSISGDITIPSTLGGYSVTRIGNYAFDWRTSLKSITIPNSVTRIGYYAFRGCTSLTSITIPDSVTSIGYDAFYHCTSLTNITVDTNNKYYSSDSNGVLFDKNKTELIQYPAGNTSSSYVIPDSVTSIGDWAFYDCESLTSITIPCSVTSIGDHAFYYCTSLTSITILEGVTSIGSWAFYNCESLTSITIPDSVTSIDDYAFNGCTSLTSITIPDSVTSIGNHAFYNCTSLTSITIPDSVTSIDDSAFGLCKRLIDVYYGGTKEQWNKITIGKENTITKGKFHFSSSQMNHPYLPTDIIILPTCENYGYTIYACDCGYSYKGDIVEAKGHTYSGQMCTSCGEKCSCNCHKTGIANFFWKIANFFNKLFKIKNKQMCACGVAHY